MTPRQPDGPRGRHVRAGGILALLVLGCAARAHAAEQPAPDALALEKLAARVAQEIADGQAEPPVAILVRAGSPSFARTFTTLIAARLARQNLAPVAVEAPELSSGEMEARAAGARALVRLTLSLEGGLLRARGDLLGTWVNFWSGSTPTRPASPAAVIDASMEADAQSLTLAIAAPASRSPAAPAGADGLRLESAVFARLPRWTAALAAGDLNGDGRDEVVALTDEEIVVFSPDGRVLARRELRSLPVSASPSREPFGAVSVDPVAHVVSYLSAQRALGEALTPVQVGARFRVAKTLERAPLAQIGGEELTGELVPGQNAFRPEIALAGNGSRWTAPGAFTTLSAFAAKSGPEILLVFPSGAAAWRRGFAAGGPSLELRGLGAASALADLDGDGAAEIATTEPAWAPSPEVLRILRAPSSVASTGGAADPLFRAELSRGRALQIAAADLNGDRAQELVVALWLPDGTAELQVFGRAP